MAGIVPSRRVRGTPFTAGVQAAGAKAYTVYNHMLLPSYFESYEADYRHLKEHVQVWDVAVERQVSIKGPDALRLMKLMSPRDMDRMADDQCYYVPICDHNGGMLNDPVAIKLAQDHYWLSLADGDLLQYALGLAIASKMDVEIVEPDVSPLAVQGPKADELMSRVFGDDVRDIRFFRYKRMAFMDTEFVVARSGWSKQGGFEIYVDGTQFGMPLWDALMPEDYIGKSVIEAQKENGTPRQIRPIEISGSGDLPHNATGWSVYVDGKNVGLIASATWSPDFNTNVAIGMIDAGYWEAGQELIVDTGVGGRSARVKDRFWI
ncbi:MAG: dimethylsulfoniopropionate demethylase [Rhodobacteraceae bacterium]|nr:dimethylsulfoniopropionate demethylase [Paracoccaceae bacterium]